MCNVLFWLEKLLHMIYSVFIQKLFKELTQSFMLKLSALVLVVVCTELLTFIVLSKRRMIVTCRHISTSVVVSSDFGFTPRDGVHEKGKKVW